MDRMNCKTINGLLRIVAVAVVVLAPGAGCGKDDGGTTVDTDTDSPVDLGSDTGTDAMPDPAVDGTPEEDAGVDPDAAGDAHEDDDGAPVPTIFEQFNPPWDGVNSPDGIWRIAGTWVGTGGNTLRPENAELMETYEGQPGGYLALTVRANVLEGGEIQTLPTYGYGYYEVRMKVATVPGVCVSFFWKEVDYGPGEIDIEFLTNEPWLESESQGTVHYTIHPDWDVYDTAYAQDLGFNPSADFHTYGFLWTPVRLDYTVDGAIVKTFTNPPAANLENTMGGYIMMNAWTGNENWGGGPPTEDATVVYDWVKFYDGLTSLP
jgi:beta-glucanase (GH16 family)